MITILAPAKRMEMGAPDWAQGAGAPFFKAQTQALVASLQGYSVAEVKKLMKVSEAIARGTVDRFAALPTGVEPTPAIFAYRGDAFQGIDAESLDAASLAWAEGRLRILSGLYGALSPMTGVGPYRLEMGLSLPGYGVLSSWWRSEVTAHLMGLLSGDGVLLNLASGEYAKAVDKKSLKGRVVDVGFKERRGEALKVVAIHAKRARGAMVRWIIENRIDDVDAVRGFDLHGYRFDAAVSTEGNLIFVREGG